MLKNLFGSESVEKVLFFLFVNGKGYGSQIQKLLKAPLTPIQKALQRLERDGIVLSYFEGNIRAYKFAPTCPYLTELQQLLRKAFTLLTTSEQRKFYAGQHAEYALESAEILRFFWKKLSRVTSFSLAVHSGTQEIKKGEGKVTISKQNDELIFHEKGEWEGDPSVCFSNAYRWTLDFKLGVISLEHLRKGVDRPVQLLHLAPSSAKSLTSMDGHFCAEDTYFGKIHAEKEGLRLKWRIIGANKNQEIICIYKY